MSDIFLITDSAEFSYADLFARVNSLAIRLKNKPVKNIIVLESENNFDCYVKVLALIESRHPFLVLPLYLFNNLKYREFLNSELKSSLIFCSLNSDITRIADENQQNRLHNLIQIAVNSDKTPFLVRTSGSSGNPHKFILHDAELFLKKYQKVGPHFQSTFAFSPAESIAGIETLLECVMHGKKLIAAQGTYSPDKISKLLGLHHVDYFQTTPSFLNLMLFAGELKSDKLPYLKKIAYGSEPSYSSTTNALKKALPFVDLIHTYGMSEIGILKTITDQARADSFKFDNFYNEGRIIDGYLEVKSATPMLGYLNYINEEASDWFRTGDLSEIDSNTQLVKVLGREGDLINVAGQKFFPIELETLVLEMAEIIDVLVAKEKHSLVGEAIVMKLNLDKNTTIEQFQKKFKVFCENKLPRFMHPHRLIFVDQPLSNDRFKKVRVE
ncbi:AMP-binding protein [bacterium]|nr:AMP-binding protein [bacterium]